VGDPVQLFYDIPAAEVGDSVIEAALAQSGDYVQSVLGSGMAPDARRPHGAVVIARDEQTIALQDGGKATFTAVLTLPAASVDADALAAAHSPEVVRAVEVYLASRDLAALKREAAAGALQVTLDGQRLTLEVGKHVFWSVADRA